MRHLGCLLVLAALAGAGELAPVTLPVASQGVPDKADDPDRVILSVDQSGFIHWKGKKVNLAELGTILRNMRDAYDLQGKRRGVSHGLRSKPGKLYVLLRADRETPWQHVQWLLTIMAEQRLLKIQFAVKQKAGPDKKPPAHESKLRADLPSSHDVGRLNAIRVIVHIVARKEVQAKWGPDGVPVMKPTAFLYRFGDRTTGTMEAVSKWIRDAKKAAAGAKGAQVVGEIRAGYKVPFGRVVGLVNEFRTQGLEHVDFFATEIPGKDRLRLPYLPYPKKNYATPPD